VNVEAPLFGLSQRLPPANVEAEQALLGALLANNKAYERVAEFLVPEHFADPIHGRIYQSISRRIEAGQLARRGSPAIAFVAAISRSGTSTGSSSLARRLRHYRSTSTTHRRSRCRRCARVVGGSGGARSSPICANQELSSKTRMR
jgi:hypothetical protein